MSTTEKALVLKVGRFKEADCWVRLLTPTRGVFNGFAFGGSRSRRRFVGCLDPLSHVLFTIGSSRRGEYIVLEEGSLLNNFPAVRGDSTKTGVAVNCVKFIEALEIDPGDGEPVYSLLLETLQLLEEVDGNIEFVPWLFRAKLAFDMGFRPDFLTCGICGDPVRNEAGYHFGVEKGQVACPTCLSGGKTVRGICPADFQRSPARPGLDTAKPTGRLGNGGHGSRGPPPVQPAHRIVRRLSPGPVLGERCI